MTLDKAIEVYEFWANAHERDAEYHRPLGYSHETIANVSEMQAREERQLAEWLKELRERRANDESSNSEFPNNCETCRHYTLACDLFSEICKYEPKVEPQKWEKPPEFDHKGIQTACVSVPMALIEDEPQTEYERASEQREHDNLYEPTYNEYDGSM